MDCISCTGKRPKKASQDKKYGQNVIFKNQVQSIIVKLAEFQSNI